MNKQEILNTMLQQSGQSLKNLSDKDVAHLFIHQDQVLSSNLTAGLRVDVDRIAEGVDVSFDLAAGVKQERPVQVCFGVLPQEGLQRINMRMRLGADSQIAIIAHCVFPNAVNVQHIMNADIELAEGARYSYFERHVHGQNGGIKVYPHAKVTIAERAEFQTEFELLKGRVGLIDIDYEATCAKHSVMEMNARINGREDDTIIIREAGHLNGEYARGVLTSRIALREQATAEITNLMNASAPYARGHVDCKEIVQDQSVAKAIPIVEVNNPKANVTHEAAIGSVNSKQLATLMSRGLTEEDATEMIIQGLLS